MKPLSECFLYGIVDAGYVHHGRMASMAAALIGGGVDILQLRAKRAEKSDVLTMAEELVPLCREAGIPFIINDHPELVALTGADGAHVGQGDLSVAEARRIAGPGAIIGKSTHSLGQAMAASAEEPDYIGFGPLFATPTKPDYTPIGTVEIRAAHEKLSLPIFCIGGIKHSNLGTVLAAGARRVVIVSDLLLAADPSAQASSCKALISV